MKLPRFRVRTLVGLVTVPALGLGAYLNSGGEIGYTLSEEEATFLDQSVKDWTYKDFEKAVPQLSSMIVEYMRAQESAWRATKNPGAVYLKSYYVQDHLGFVVTLSDLMSASRTESPLESRYIAGKVVNAIAQEAENLGLKIPEGSKIRHPFDWLRAFASEQTFSGTTPEQREALMAEALKSWASNSIVANGIQFSVMGPPITVPSEEERQAMLNRPGALARAIPNFIGRDPSLKDIIERSLWPCDFTELPNNRELRRRELLRFCGLE